MYTKKDMKNLEGYLISIKGLEIDCSHDIERVMYLCHNHSYKFEKMRKEARMLLEVLSYPFEEVPLHINDRWGERDFFNDLYDIDRILCNWRLRRGK